MKNKIRQPTKTAFFLPPDNHKIHQIVSRGLGTSISSWPRRWRSKCLEELLFLTCPYKRPILIHSVLGLVGFPLRNVGQRRSYVPIRFRVKQKLVRWRLFGRNASCWQCPTYRRWAISPHKRQDKDDEEDQDGRSVLQARFEDEVPVKDWLVPVAAALKCLDVKLFLLCVQKFEFKLFVYVVGARMANVRKKI